jgi:hypothetical protein
LGDATTDSYRMYAQRDTTIGALDEVADGAAIANAAATADDTPAATARRARKLAAENWQFSIVVAGAAALRCVVMLGYPPAMFFNDSYNYMTDAVTKSPDVVRSSGYPLFLYLLLPFRNLNLVTALQALMGLAMGIAIYAVLRRRGLPWWGATVCALPVLFDVFELQLEHMVASDVLFCTLITAALVLLCWWDRPPLLVAVLVGLLAGYAATVRNVGEAMLIIFLAGMLLRRMGWRRLAATAVAGLVPIGGYMIWFHARYGHYALNEESGTSLYSRVQSFAECSKMSPPPGLRVLCDPRPPDKRPNSQEYLWSDQTPLAYLTGDNNIYRFTPQINSLTMKFAERAIEAQPLDYARVVARDALTTFNWHRANTGNAIGNLEGSGSLFRFEPTVAAVPGWVTGNAANARAAKDYGGANYGQPKVVQPWAGFLQAYQAVVYLRGPFLLLFVAIGFIGVAAAPRRSERRGRGRGGLTLLPWLTGAALIMLPPMTAGFSYRYVLAAVPAACLAAGLAFAGRGNLIVWLRGHGLSGRSTPAAACGQVPGQSEEDLSEPAPGLLCRTAAGISSVRPGGRLRAGAWPRRPRRSGTACAGGRARPRRGSAPGPRRTGPARSRPTSPRRTPGSIPRARPGPTAASARS